MSKMSSSNHYIRLDESFPTMYRSRGCRQGPDTSRRLLQLYYCAETAVWQPVLQLRGLLLGRYALYIVGWSRLRAC
jgi:hypothetical protein